MTRNELLKKLCEAEGGKRQALDWPQAKETYAKLRKIIGEETGIDLDDIVGNPAPMTIYHMAHGRYRAFPFYVDWPYRKPRSRKPAAKAARRGK